MLNSSACRQVGLTSNPEALSGSLTESRLETTGTRAGKLDLPRQGKTRHRWLSPFGEQSFVKIVEWSSAAIGF